MKNLELTSMGVQEMSTIEMKETDGGFIWLLVVAGALLLGTSSCLNTNNSYNIQIGTGNSSDLKNQGTMSADSTLNGNSVTTDIMPVKEK